MRYPQPPSPDERPLAAHRPTPRRPRQQPRPVNIRLPSPPPPAHSATPKSGLLILALVYTAFVIYGSLVPWNYTPVPMTQAWQTFRHLPYLDLGIGSRADWVANILLFIPLAFLWQGVLWPRRSLLLRLFTTLLVLAAATGLSVGIEFTQVFFPPRTVSQNDILAETIGAVVGVTAWWWMGPATWLWVRQWLSVRGTANVAERLLWVYLTILFGYSLLPLDLTISPVEVYHKWSDGKVILIPFGYPIQGLAQRLYDIATDILVWIPISALWVWSGKKTRGQAWAQAVLVAVLLESMQLLVYSRVTDVTDILMAMVGAALGTALVRTPSGPRETPTQEGPHRHYFLWGITGFVVWCAILAALFWHPFDFQLERNFLTKRLALLQQIPFYNYYYGTEFRAVTEVLHKVTFFAPLGACLGIARLALPPSPVRTGFDILACAAFAGVALGIELGQVALPSKYPDSTDWLLATLGALGGYLVTLFIQNRHTGATAGNPPSPQSGRGRGSGYPSAATMSRSQRRGTR